MIRNFMWFWFFWCFGLSIESIIVLSVLKRLIYIVLVLTNFNPNTKRCFVFRYNDARAYLKQKVPFLLFCIIVCNIFDLFIFNHSYLGFGIFVVLVIKFNTYKNPPFPNCSDTWVLVHFIYKCSTNIKITFTTRCSIKIHPEKVYVSQSLWFITFLILFSLIRFLFILILLWIFFCFF